MLYTVLGGVVGSAATYLFCVVASVDSTSNRFFPSNREIFTVLGAAIGAAVGFGVGSNKLVNGQYP